MLDLESLASLPPERIRPIRRVEYERMAELGMFEDQKVELLGGLVVEVSPQGTRHVEAVMRLNEIFGRALPAGRARVAPQLPFALSDISEPEPDLVLVPVRDYSHEHPAVALLVVEVAQSSLHKDRRIKAALYAAAGIPEYWIVNLEDDQLEVHRAPAATGYDEVVIHRAGAEVRPLAFPDFAVQVADLLPAR